MRNQPLRRFFGLFALLAFFAGCNPTENSTQSVPLEAAAQLLQPGDSAFQTAVRYLRDGLAEGVFTGTVWRDELRLEINAEDGGKMEFYCLSSACDRFVDNTEMLGKSIRVHWQQVERYLPETGKRVALLEVKAIDLL